MNDNTTPYISLRNVSFSYEIEDGVRLSALKNVSLDINKGDFVAVLGHNGSGKSTLAKLLNMILAPDSGTIIIDGKDITSKDMTEDDVFDIRRHVGMVFQNPDNQLVATIVEEDIAFGCENLGIPPKEIRKRVDDALETVGMTEFARHEPHQLSGGQKQRVAIAGIIAMLPDTIIFDESTAMLDPAGRDEVMRTISSLNHDYGITVLHITHNMSEAIEADRVIVINDGEVYMDGTPAEVFSQVEKLKSVGLDVPQVTDLIWRLKKLGCPVSGDALSPEAAAEAMLPLLKV
ncbi:MAG TPA: energy-coupling factor transporter ATPase [Clostridiales bacterium]|jgi:energy-coupling factor transport system ATP-binding protein|nr:energy-coupling factor transporter ATPase [Clostridiales bacterium]